MVKHEPQGLPAPRPGDTFGTLESRMMRHVDGRRLRPKKEKEQFNTDVRPGFKDDLADAQRKVAAEVGRDFTRGEFLDMLLTSFKESRAPGAVEAVLKRGRRPEAPAQDQAQERTHHLEFFASTPMRTELHAVMERRKWTLGAVIENFMALGVQGQKALEELEALKARIRR